MTEYLDIRCGDDLDPFARDARPLEVLGQDLYHWLITNKGELLQDPDWGMGLPSYLGKPLPFGLAGDIETKCRDVFSDRVSAAQCTIVQTDVDSEAYTMKLIAEVDGDFLTIALQLTPSGIVKVT